MSQLQLSHALDCARKLRPYYLLIYSTHVFVYDIAQSGSRRLPAFASDLRLLGHGLNVIYLLDIGTAFLLTYPANDKIQDISQNAHSK